MQYCSTRNNSRLVSSAEAIVTGLSPDGGLFLPVSIPSITTADIKELAQMDYPQRAAKVLSLFLSDFSYQELLDYTQQAYAYSKFPVAGTAPVVKLDNSAYVLELFHGPTCAFKDFALQMLPLLLTASIKKCQLDKDVIILVATSGDTGKAALEGFADVAATNICVFYPHGGTSNIQRRQMCTQSGNNVMVAAVKGNFDDAQTAVKKIFTNREYAEKLDQKGYMLSSANSINWGRLAPQIAYYVSAYCDLLNTNQIQPGQSINVCVPTGNFGNILAAYYAKCCGLPINKLICASNRNNVLTDFINSGTYDRKRTFYLTSSPSMDILVSSNLERLLYLLSQANDAQICDYMNKLNIEGAYTITPSMLEALQKDFYGGYCEEDATATTIKEIYAQHNYLCDTHTAVAVHVYQNYRTNTGDTTPTVIASTASPFKFCGSVLPALGEQTDADEFSMLDKLSRLTSLPIPQRLAELRDKEERFTDVVDPSDMIDVVNRLL